MAEKLTEWIDALPAWYDRVTEGFGKTDPNDLSIYLNENDE